MTEKHLPYSIDAECGVLGSILIDPEAIVEVADRLKPSDFYRDGHSVIYAAMKALYEQRELSDFITLCDELERHDKLEAVGGASYLSSLSSHVPTSSNIESYATIVERASLCRAVIHAAGQIAAIGFEQDPQVLLKAQQIMLSLGRRQTSRDFQSMDELIPDYMERLDALHANRGTFAGVSTGYRDLDAGMGALQEQEFIILGGRPGTGKTAAALNIAVNVARAGHGVAVFSLEMGAQQLAMRMMGMESGINTRRLQDGWIDDDEWDGAVKSASRLTRLPMWINDAPGNPIASMRSQLHRLMQQVKIKLIVVDYLQLIEPDGDQSRYENRVNEVGKISRGLKLLAKETGATVLACAQLSRKVEERSSKVPMLSDLRESGTLEQDADKVLLLYRDDYYAEIEQRQSERPGITDIIVAKYRNGSPGTVCLRYHAAQTLFTSLEA